MKDSVICVDCGMEFTIDTDDPAAVCPYCKCEFEYDRTGLDDDNSKELGHA
jgi:hypothetical protein